MGRPGDRPAFFFGKHFYRLRAPLTAIDPVNPQIPSRLNPQVRVPAPPPAFQVMTRVREPGLEGWVADGVLAYSGMSPKMVKSELSWCDHRVS